MIMKCITGVGITTGVVGLMAFSAVQEESSTTSSPVPVEIATTVSVPVGVPTTVSVPVGVPSTVSVPFGVPTSVSVPVGVATTVPLTIVTASSAPLAIAAYAAPVTDEETVATEIISPWQATKPRRVSKEIRQKTQDIRKALAELSKALEQADSTYEKNEINDRITELKEVLKSTQEKASPFSRVSKAKPNSDASKLRKRFSAAKRKIAELHEQGRYEEAVALTAEVEQAAARTKQSQSAIVKRG